MVRRAISRFPSRILYESLCWGIRCEFFGDERGVVLKTDQGLCCWIGKGVSLEEDAVHVGNHEGMERASALLSRNEELHKCNEVTQKEKVTRRGGEERRVRKRGSEFDI